MIDDGKRRRRLGIAVQAARLHAKMDIVDVSAASHVHRNTISRAEKGLHRLSLQHLERISSALGTKAWFVLRVAEERVEPEPRDLAL